MNYETMGYLESLQGFPTAIMHSGVSREEAIPPNSHNTETTQEDIIIYIYMGVCVCREKERKYIQYV